MVRFEIFWDRFLETLRAASSPQAGVHVLSLPKWSQASGPLPGEITVVYRGGSLIHCDTTSTDNWRAISSAEVRRVYDVWRDYREGRRGRSFIVHTLGVHNSTWIIPVLYRYEHLMN